MLSKAGKKNTKRIKQGPKMLNLGLQNLGSERPGPHGLLDPHLLSQVRFTRNGNLSAGSKKDEEMFDSVIL